jgi:hypothetical protein
LLLASLLLPTAAFASCSIEDARASRAGNDVQVYGRAACGGGVRAIRFSADGSIFYELGAPEATATWHPPAGASGAHAIRIEAAEWGDNDWSRAASRIISIDLGGGASGTTGTTGGASTGGSSAASPPTSSSSGPCRDGAAFVSDVTYSDGAHVTAGQRFTKTWRLRNSGSCTWGDWYTVNFIGGDDLGATAMYAVSRTSPGATVDISLDLVAPTNSGSYQANYQLNNADGRYFGPRFWALITVDGAVSPSPVSSAPVSGLLAPVAAGIGLTVTHGYNDPLPSESCVIGTARDHCAHQKYGLDLVPDSGWDGTILAPASGRVAWATGDCMGIILSDGVHLTLCHFGRFSVTSGMVQRGQPLGQAHTSWVHMSLDDGRVHFGQGASQPYPFNGSHALEGLSFDPGSDSQRDQWDGVVFVSSNVRS